MSVPFRLGPYPFQPFVIALLAAVLAACDGTGSPIEPRAGGGVAVRDAWVHAVPGAGQGAVYFVIENGSALDDRLLRVETGAALVAELHETVDQNGVMRMIAHPEGVGIPAGSAVIFAPGGKHVMLIEPRLGDEAIELTLVFERAGEVRVEASLTAPES